MKLCRYWLNFDNIDSFSPLSIGCGVTAYDKDDLYNILSDTIFSNSIIPETLTIYENIDIGTLDQGHVIPNMEAPDIRGVWFPKGFRYNN
jgi:hypothetical protein